jgi:hypothetical protein
MAVVADAVQAEQFAGHLKAGHLVAAIGRGYGGLEETGAHGIQRRERLAATKQRIAAVHRTPRADQIVQRLHVVLVQPDRKAQFAQIAVRAGDLERIGPDRQDVAGRRRVHGNRLSHRGFALAGDRGGWHCRTSRSGAIVFST